MPYILDVPDYLMTVVVGKDFDSVDHDFLLNVSVTIWKNFKNGTLNLVDKSFEII